MSATTLPAYDTTPTISVSEKDSTFCPTHGPSPTPKIDSLLTTPSSQKHLLALSKTLTDLAETGCSRCATESILKISTEVMGELHQQRKSGAWSKEEKKALKREGKVFKEFLKPLRREMKEGLKGQKK